MPSLGYGVIGGDPNSRAVFDSLSQNTARGRVPSAAAAASSRYPESRGWSTAMPSPSSDKDGGGAPVTRQVLRNHRVGNTDSGASAGPWFSTVIRASTSVGDALAYATSTDQ